MKRLLIIPLAFATVACASNSNTDTDGYNYALVDHRGTQFSMHQTQSECDAAAMRQNISKINDLKVSGPEQQKYFRTLRKAVCQEI